MNIRLMTLSGALLVLGALPGLAEKNPNGRTGGSTVDLATPVGQVQRYIVTDMESITVGSYARSQTIVSVFNNGPVACNVSVEWLYAGGGSICTSNYGALGAGNSAVFCTRGTNPAPAYCDRICSPELTFHQGNARVASTNSANCAKIAVAGRVVYYGPSDSTITGITEAKIVKKGLGNTGD